MNYLTCFIPNDMFKRQFDWLTKRSIWADLYGAVIRSIYEWAKIRSSFNEIVYMTVLGLCQKKLIMQIRGKYIRTRDFDTFTDDFNKSHFACWQLDHSIFRPTGNLVNWQTIHISGETTRYELSLLNLHWLQKPLIAFVSVRWMDFTVTCATYRPIKLTYDAMGIWNKHLNIDFRVR